MSDRTETIYGKSHLMNVVGYDLAFRIEITKFTQELTANDEDAHCDRGTMTRTEALYFLRVLGYKEDILSGLQEQNVVNQKNNVIKQSENVSLLSNRRVRDLVSIYKETSDLKGSTNCAVISAGADRRDEESQDRDRFRDRVKLDLDKNDQMIGDTVLDSALKISCNYDSARMDVVSDGSEDIEHNDSSRLLSVGGVEVILDTGNGEEPPLQARQILIVYADGSSELHQGSGGDENTNATPRPVLDDPVIVSITADEEDGPGAEFSSDSKWWQADDNRDDDDDDDDVGSTNGECPSELGLQNDASDESLNAVVTKRKEKRKTVSQHLFKCTQCQYMCLYNYQLKSHMFERHGVKCFACRLCRGNFNMLSSLKTHMRSKHPGNLAYKCRMCAREYTSSDHLRSHVKNHSTLKIKKPRVARYLCTECGYLTKEQCSLIAHMRKHTGEKPFKCTLCDMQFRQQTNLTQHLVTHRDEKEYLCTECGSCFKTTSSLSRHMRQHSKRGMFKCDQCDYTCYSEHLLGKHARKHTGERPFKCLRCQSSFKYQTNLRQHMTTHSIDKMYKCCVCGRKFGRADYLRRHMLVHSDARPHQCPHCASTFKHPTALKVHVDNKHTGETKTDEKKHECPECGFTASRVHGLRVHMRSHSDNKLFQCTLCDFQTHLANSLKIHIRRHTGEKPYKCSQCDYVASNSSHVRIHRKVHSDVKPFVCSVCGHAFRRNDNLVIHMRTHTGEQPFKCGDCGYSCKQRVSLTTHMKKHLAASSSQ